MPWIVVSIAAAVLIGFLAGPRWAFVLVVFGAGIALGERFRLAVGAAGIDYSEVHLGWWRTRRTRFPLNTHVDTSTEGGIELEIQPRNREPRAFGPFREASCLALRDRIQEAIFEFRKDVPIDTLLKDD